MRFVPEDWLLTDKLREYAHSKGLTSAQIDDQEEAFRLCQFPRKILCWDRAWMRWIRNSIEWGRIVPTRKPNYRRPDEPTEAERKADILKAEDNFNRLRAVK